MKLCILYHTNDEFSRQVDEFEGACLKRTTKSVEKISLESPEGASLASVYGILSYPAILVLTDDGQLYRGWQGSSLPPVDEVIVNLNA